ncbi:MAG: GC-type dockerin domain-anchored protein [Phycisphaerales bacterium]
MPGGSTGMASFTNNGTLTLSNGTSLPRNGGTAATATLTNNSLMVVTNGASSVDGLTVVNSSQGVVRVAGDASLTLPVDWNMTGGRFEGTGVFYSGGLGFVNAGGTVAPGAGTAIGTLTSNQRYNQNAGGTLEIGLVSNGVTQSCDRLVLANGGFNGQATLGGTLRVTLPAGTSPAPIGGTDMLILDAPGGVTGQFTTLVAADPIDNIRYMVVYTPTQVFLRIIQRCGGADMGSVGADANFDGMLDNNDFVVFINMFFNQDPHADVGVSGGLVGSDGRFDNNDFIAFITLFFSGCP